MRKAARAVVAFVLCLAMVFAGQVPASAAEQDTPEAIQCADFDEAVKVLRKNLVQREPVVAVSFVWEDAEIQTAEDLLNEALAHTGVPTEGDYLYRHMKQCHMQIMPMPLENGHYQLTLTYTLVYRSTAEQETQVDAAVKTLLDQLDVYEATEYEKVCAIYDYICKNVTYDMWGLMTGNQQVYTAYAALIKKSAVCQGYASLFYRLALELGVDARVISGTSKERAHAWNIVRLGGKYYNLDSTWDADNAQDQLPYAYFLQCDANFAEHDRNEDYDTEQFRGSYVMADMDYDPSTPLLKGDLTGDGQVDEDDAVYLLQYVLMPDVFKVDQTVDLDKNGKTDEDDAIYLLQYVLMPETFPLH